jgi:hypothetical protein
VSGRSYREVNARCVEDIDRSENYGEDPAAKQVPADGAFDRGIAVIQGSFRQTLQTSQPPPIAV